MVQTFYSKPSAILHCFKEKAPAMKKQVDNFDLLKEEFEIRFKKKWDHSPSLYIQYYQARVLDALLLAFTQSLHENKAKETRDRSRLESLRKVLERNGFAGPKRYKKV